MPTLAAPLACPIRVLCRRLVIACLALCVGLGTACAWQPERPIQFIVTAGPGGGTDQFARAIEGIVRKHKLVAQPIEIIYKNRGEGAEGFVHTRFAEGDAHTLVLGTSNAWLLPLSTQQAFRRTDLTPVASMAEDEFVLWVRTDLPYRDVKSFLDAARREPRGLRMGGSQRRDTDQTLTRLIEQTASVRFNYVAYKGGGEAAKKLAEGQVHANTNNPGENREVWLEGKVRPLCVFSHKRLLARAGSTPAWDTIPTCIESGLAIENYQMPRTIFLPPRVTSATLDFYVALMGRVRETAEWKEYLVRTAQTDRFATGDAFERLMREGEALSRRAFQAEGW